MTNFLRKRWIPLIIWALIIILASSNTNPLFGMDRALRGVTLLGINLELIVTLITQVFSYLILAVFLVRALAWTKDPGALVLLTVFLLAILFALANEGIQILIPGRPFDWRDLLMAGWGTLLGLIVYVLLRRQPAQSDEEADLLL